VLLVNGNMVPVTQVGHVCDPREAFCVVIGLSHTNTSIRAVVGSGCLGLHTLIQPPNPDSLSLPVNNKMMIMRRMRPHRWSDFVGAPNLSLGVGVGNGVDDPTTLSFKEAKGSVDHSLFSQSAAHLPPISGDMTVRLREVAVFPPGSRSFYPKILGLPLPYLPLGGTSGAFLTGNPSPTW
jgi:hypothetical protein